MSVHSIFLSFVLAFLGPVLTFFSFHIAVILIFLFLSHIKQLVVILFFGIILRLFLVILRFWCLFVFNLLIEEGLLLSSVLSRYQTSELFRDIPCLFPRFFFLIFVLCPLSCSLALGQSRACSPGRISWRFFLICWNMCSVLCLHLLFVPSEKLIHLSSRGFSVLHKLRLLLVPLFAFFKFNTQFCDTAVNFRFCSFAHVFTSHAIFFWTAELTRSSLERVNAFTWLRTLLSLMFESCKIQSLLSVFLLQLCNALTRTLECSKLLFISLREFVESFSHIAHPLLLFHTLFLEIVGFLNFPQPESVRRFSESLGQLLSDFPFTFKYFVICARHKRFHVFEGSVYCSLEPTFFGILFFKASSEFAVSARQDLSKGLLISLETYAFFLIHSIFDGFLQCRQFLTLSTHFRIGFLHFDLNLLHNLWVLL